MRADHSLPQSPFFGRAGGQRRSQVFAARALIVQAGHLTARTDRRDMFGHQGCQLRGEFTPHADEVFPSREERPVVGRQFAPAMWTLFQQKIPRPQHPLVSPQIFQIPRLALAGQKIEKPPPLRRRPAHQVDVLVGKKRDQPDPQIFIRFPLRHPIQFQLPPLLRRIMAGQLPVPAPPDQRKPPCPAPHRLAQRARPRRLQPQSHTNPLQQRRLPTRVGRTQEVQARRRPELGSQEAAKVVENERIKHGKVSGFQCAVIPWEKKIRRCRLAANDTLVCGSSR